jgi:hypothetical protein
MSIGLPTKLDSDMAPMRTLITQDVGATAIDDDRAKFWSADGMRVNKWPTFRKAPPVLAGDMIADNSASCFPEAELDDVAVLHDIVLALDPRLADGTGGSN